MVTYNQEPFVAEAIESVLAQSFANFELLVCDDASTDRTWEIVRGYADRRIRASRNPVNVGEYPNRTLALGLARGKYIIFIDGDDGLYPHALGVMAETMDRFPDAAFSSALPASEKFIYPVELSPGEYYACQFLGPNITAPNFTQLMFRTERLREAGGFDPRYRSGDTHIQFVLARSHPAVLMGNGLAWWRRYPGQASESLLRERWGTAEFTRYGQELLAHPQCPMSPKDRCLALANLRRSLIRAVVHFALRGRFAHAVRLLRYSRVPMVSWGHLLSRERRPFWQEVDGRNPLSPLIQRSRRQ
jgi:glycosyltransferase involved in cell wall biosynthesis